MTIPSGAGNVSSGLILNSSYQPPRWYRSLLLLMLLAAIGVRCYRLNLFDLSADETFSWRLSQYSWEDLLAHAAADVHPPLYYLLLKGVSLLFGTSPAALRALSVLFSVASGLVFAVLCREVFLLRGRDIPSPGIIFSAALVGIFVLSFHPDQIKHGQEVRMYSLGVFLAGLTAWLLLRALRAQRVGVAWWAAYAAAAAAFCYTHYYAFFTLLAQGLFVAAYLGVRGWKEGWNSIAQSVWGFTFAAAFASLLYSPWIPVLLAQTQTVHEDYWIAPVTAKGILYDFSAWSSGMPFLGDQEQLVWGGMLLTAIGWLLYRCRWAAGFLLLQAVTPWVVSLALSLASGRSIFLQRYFFFAQFTLIGLIALLWSTIPRLIGRLLLACLLGLACFSGLVSHWESLPKTPPSLMPAVRFLAEHYRTGDVVWTSGPSNLNRLRYYASQAGVGPFETRCFMAVKSKGHTPHLASLESRDIITTTSLTSSSLPNRVWLVGNGRPQPEITERVQMTPQLEVIFALPGDVPYFIVLCRTCGGVSSLPCDDYAAFFAENGRCRSGVLAGGYD